ncbi:MAG: hypothetical protein F6K40_39370 [Okeania sp. SIO3I5]|uniref:hypothetical protein n=1 Tax=Okeania sp. SIO3I5 TaxID=2607805 RepID=UPI0013BE4906|nr:hypothetical protein [Okeania sp. SIO3I5]NEQ41920.1 hypothetical protein [Okeania sp. SIO3I5]
MTKRKMKKTTNFTETNQQSLLRRRVKHILKALSAATVSTLSLLSLCLTSAQAASFVTVFETSRGNLSLEWSGDDLDGDGTIDFSELSGPLVLGTGLSRASMGTPTPF